MSLSVTSVTANYTIANGNLAAYMVDASSGAITLTLPDATSIDGSQLYIKRVDSSINNSCSIVCQNSQKLDGASSTNLAIKKFFHVMAYNNNWSIIG